MPAAGWQVLVIGLVSIGLFFANERRTRSQEEGVTKGTAQMMVSF